MSAEEGMRRELAVEEPTETAGNLAFYASSVSASAATFPMGDGLDRAILNYSKITTALRWLHKSPYFSGQRSTQRQGDKRQRRSRLNRVTRTIAERFAQSTSESSKTLPRGSNGGRSPLGLSFSHIFLQTRKIWPPEGLPKRECR